jgi:hypothetical protein
MTIKWLVVLFKIVKNQGNILTVVYEDFGLFGMFGAISD